jgi:hypothetical protein
LLDGAIRLMFIKQYPRPVGLIAINSNSWLSHASEPDDIELVSPNQNHARLRMGWVIHPLQDGPSPFVKEFAATRYMKERVD